MCVYVSEQPRELAFKSAVKEGEREIYLSACVCLSRAFNGPTVHRVLLYSARVIYRMGEYVCARASVYMAASTISESILINGVFLALFIPLDVCFNYNRTRAPESRQ